MNENTTEYAVLTEKINMLEDIILYKDEQIKTLTTTLKFKEDLLSTYGNMYAYGWLDYLRHAFERLLFRLKTTLFRGHYLALIKQYKNKESTNNKDK